MTVRSRVARGKERCSFGRSLTGSKVPKAVDFKVAHFKVPKQNVFQNAEKDPNIRILFFL